MATFTSPEDEAFFGAIGRLTISYAYLELFVDSVVSVIHHSGGSTHIEREMPRSFKRKIAYLRKFTNKAPINELAREGYRVHLRALNHASEKRHDVIHGVVTEHAERSGKATFVRVMHERGKTHKREVELTTTDIMKIAREIDELADKTYYWATEFQRLVLALSESGDAQNR